MSVIFEIALSGLSKAQTDFNLAIGAVIARAVTNSAEPCLLCCYGFGCSFTRLLLAGPTVDGLRPKLMPADMTKVSQH